MTAAITWTKRIGVLLVVGMALWHLALRVQLIDDRRVDIGGAEMNVVYGIQKILLGRPLYEDPEQPPFDVMQYTPAYYELCAGLAGLLGIGDHDTVALFSLSRIVSLILNLFTCLLVWRLCRSIGADAWLSIAVAAIAFTLFTEHFYSRVDSLYALPFVGTLALHLRWIERRTALLPLATALTTVLCLLSKQTGLLAIGIIGAHLLITAQWRALMEYLSAAVAFVTLALFFILRDTTPQILLKNVVQGIANGTSGTLYKELFPLAVYKYYAPLHLMAILLIVRAVRKGDAIDRFLAIAMVAALLFGFVTGMKHGSNINYLFEAHLLILIGAARWLGQHASRWRPQFALGFVAFGLLFTWHRTRLLEIRVGSDDGRAHAERAHRADLRVRDVLLNELGLQPADKVYISYRGHLELLLNGQSQLTQKDVIEWSMEPLYDYSAFYRAMDSGEVTYVITDAELTDTLRLMQREWEPTTTVREVEGRWISTLP